MPSALKILQVDDEEDILVISKLALERYGGYAVTTCASSREALTVAAQVQPDLILLDLMMPGLDGHALSNAFTQDAALREVPIVFVTATIAPELRKALLDSGAAGMILKPYTPRELVAQVGAIAQAHPRLRSLAAV